MGIAPTLSLSPTLDAARTRLRAVGPGTPLDLFQVADDVVALFKGGAVAEGATALEDARRGRSQVLQDSLDRLVSARQLLCYAPPAGSGPAVAVTLARVSMAWNATPQMPDSAQMTAATEQQRHDVYASIAEVKGTEPAKAAMRAGDRVIMGLRLTQSTLDNRGQGTYNDRIVVMTRGAQARTVAVFDTANTEPTAQYDGNQRSNRNIVFRRADGDDVTRDGVPELGRLSTGTYALQATTHTNPRSAGTNFSLRPTAAAVAAGAGQVERDTNHDGLFDSNDINGRHPLNNTFKIHSGSRTNTDSAGCQTIAPGDFKRFADAVQGGTQTVWQYVLVEVRA
jgi:hypothetical protein